INESEVRRDPDLEAETRAGREAPPADPEIQSESFPQGIIAADLALQPPFAQIEVTGDCARDFGAQFELPGHVSDQRGAARKNDSPGFDADHAGRFVPGKKNAAIQP